MKRILTVILCMLWGGCFFLWPPEAQANLLQQRYPQTVSQEYLANLGREKIKQALTETGEKRRYELQLVRQPRALQLPAGQLICEVELPRGLEFQGQMPVLIKAYVNDKSYRQITIYYRIGIYDKVLVAQHDLQLERALTTADFKVEERCLENPAADYLHDAKELQDRVPIRFIKSGSILTRDMLTTPIVVQSGAPVKLLTNVNGVEVVTDGIAMQRGRLGTYIRVRNARTGKMLRGKIRDANTVEIAG